MQFRSACLVIFTLLTACGFNIPGPGLSDFSADFGNGYGLHRTSGVYVIISPEGGYVSDSEIIETRILECGYDDKFIVAKRLNWAAIPEGQWAEALERLDPKLIDYWIIDVSRKQRFGPLSEADYRDMRLKLGVSEGIILRNIYDYRPKTN